jgi:hypothetical protein
MKIGVGRYAWDVTTCAAPATRGDGNGRPTTSKSTTASGKRGQVRSPRPPQPRDKFQNQGLGQNQDPQNESQRDHAREQRRLQAEDDCVVLLCRD